MRHGASWGVAQVSVAAPHRFYGTQDGAAKKDGAVRRWGIFVMSYGWFAPHRTLRMTVCFSVVSNGDDDDMVFVKLV
jgi:hypothetical protein